MQSLLKDCEAEVRAAAAHKVRDFCQNLDPSVQESVVLNNILPCVQVRSFALALSNAIDCRALTGSFCFDELIGILFSLQGVMYKQPRWHNQPRDTIALVPVHKVLNTSNTC